MQTVKYLCHKLFPTSLHVWTPTNVPWYSASVSHACTCASNLFLWAVSRIQSLPLGLSHCLPSDVSMRCCFSTARLHLHSWEKLYLSHKHIFTVQCEKYWMRRIVIAVTIVRYTENIYYAVYICEFSVSHFSIERTHCVRTIRSLRFVSFYNSLLFVVWLICCRIGCCDDYDDDDDDKSSSCAILAILAINVLLCELVFHWIVFDFV